MKRQLIQTRFQSVAFPTLRSRLIKDRLGERLFFLVSVVPLLILLAAVWLLGQRTLPVLQKMSLWELLSGQTWRPLQGLFGFWPFIASTFWVTALAMLLAAPPCLLSAIYLSEYSQPRTRTFFKPLLDLLAGIPSVVYGVWGIITIVPAVQWTSKALGRYLNAIPGLASNNPTGFSVLAGGIVLAVMIAPFVIAVTYEVLHAVPEDARLASLAVGATRWQAVRHAVLPPALPGITAGIVLGASRALGETMAVMMVIGNVAQVPKSIFDPAYPLPALIANNYGEMLSIPLYDAALMGAALLLLLIVLFFNLVSNLMLGRIIRRMQS